MCEQCERVDGILQRLLKDPELEEICKAGDLESARRAGHDRLPKGVASFKSLALLKEALRGLGLEDECGPDNIVHAINFLLGGALKAVGLKLTLEPIVAKEAEEIPLPRGARFH